LNEKQTAKAIVDHNTSWLFLHDSSGKPILDAEGKRQLSALGSRDASDVRMAEQTGIMTVEQRSPPLGNAQEVSRMPALRVLRSLAYQVVETVIGLPVLAAWFLLYRWSPDPP